MRYAVTQDPVKLSHSAFSKGWNISIRQLPNCSILFIPTGSLHLFFFQLRLQKHLEYSYTMHPALINSSLLCNTCFANFLAASMLPCEASTQSLGAAASAHTSQEKKTTRVCQGLWARSGPTFNSECKSSPSNMSTNERNESHSGRPTCSGQTIGLVCK